MLPRARSFMEAKTAMATSLFLAIVAALCAAVLADVNPRLDFDTTNPSTRGSDFMVAFMPNKKVTVQRQPQYKLLITTAESERVYFTVSLSENLPAEMREGFPHNGNVAYGEVYTVDLPAGIPVTLTGLPKVERSKAIRVKTNDGKKITVQGFNDNERTTDGFIAISCDAMRLMNFVRYEHLVLSADSATEDASMFLIIPCDDDTRVTVHPTQRITVTSLIDLKPFYSPVTTISLLHQVEPPNIVTFTANSAQTMLVNHREDLSGTIIRANKPLVVLSGHQCGQIPFNTTACDHMVEQIPPSMVYGQTFFLPPLGGRVSGDMFRVGTLIDQTQVNVTCVTASSRNTPTSLTLEKNGLINRGEFLAFMTPGNYENRQDYEPSYCCLDASEAVVVAQYSTGYSNDEGLVGKSAVANGAAEIGDPFMSLIPPVHQYLNNYTVKSVQGPLSRFPTRFVNLAIASKFFDNSFSDRSKIKINGTTVVPRNGYIPFYCSNGNICGYGAEVEVSRGTTTIYHEQPDVGLFASYYAYQQQNSNAFPLGFELEPLAATSTRIPEFLCVREDVGVLVIDIPRYGNLNVQSRFNVNTQSLEAEGDSDYESVSQAFVYGGNRRQDRIMSVRIPIIDDDIEEDGEHFKIVFTPTQNIVFNNDTITVLICDNDGGSCMCDTGTTDAEELIDVWFEPSSYTINEEDGLATLIIRTNATAGVAEGNVQFHTRDGEETFVTLDSGILLSPAKDTKDYSSTITDVVFEAGTFTTSVVVPIIDDSIPENKELFYGVLTAREGINVLIDEAEVKIIDDDDEEVSFVQDKYTVSEASSSIEVCVRRRAVVLTPLTIEVSTVELVPAETTAGRDYAILNRVSVTIEVGKDTTCFLVDIINDNIIEESERFLVAITSVPSRVKLGVRSNTTICILDDDVVVYFEYETYKVTEEEGVVTVCVLREGRIPEALRIEVSTSDLTPPQALVNVDYLPRVGAEVSFVPGEMKACFNVVIIDDEIPENTENFTAVITAVPSGVKIGDPDTTVITIAPDNAVCDNVCARLDELEKQVKLLTALLRDQGK